MSKALRRCILACLVPTGLAAQVGHDPAHSPFRPITARTSFTALGGYLGGSGGTLGIGLANGPLLGVRYEMRLTGPTDGALGISWGHFDRFVPDPNAPADSQLTGPVRQTAIFVDGALQILLTGDKTWRGLAPYLGATLGLGFGSSVPADSSGYRYKAKFVMGPVLGLRLYPAAGLLLRVEGRLAFWRLKYPSTYFAAPARAPTEASLLDPKVESDTEWTAHPIVLIGLGWSFRL